MLIPEPRKEKYICGHCSNETDHISISFGKVDKSIRPLKGRACAFQTYDVMQCQSCKGLTLGIHNKIHPGPMMGDSYEKNTDYYPPIQARPYPAWINDLDTKKQSLLKEIYQAVNIELYTIASTGIRTLTDIIFIDQVGDIGSFDKKITEMSKKGIVDSDEKEILSIIIEAGSASAHRGYNPKKKIINHMLDALESVIEKIYIAPKQKGRLKKKVNAIKKKTPERSKKKLETAKE